LSNIIDLVNKASNLSNGHLVQYIGAQRSDGTLQIFSEFMFGSVANVLKESGKLSEAIIKRYVKNVIQALSYLHNRGFCDVNLKVSNLLIDNSGNVKLADYAAAQEVSDLIQGISRKHVEYWMSTDEKNKQSQQKYAFLLSFTHDIVLTATLFRCLQKN
jgi:serine/threonine protein kinase